MNQFYLGVDIGNTKSHALIATRDGRAVGFGQAGPGSWEALGWEGAEEVLQDITNQALTTAGLSAAAIHGAGFGFAGYDWPEDRPGHQRLVDSLHLDNAVTAFGNDTLVGLVAGATAGWGVVVVAGTSNNCRGWDRNGREGRVTGTGSWLGEYGGASEIVTRAVQAVASSWTKRGPETRISNRFVEISGATDVGDLLAGLIRGRYKLSAGMAPQIFTLAAEGDTVAGDIICWAGQELGSLANGVIRQLELEKEKFDVVLSGSLYKGSPRLTEQMQQTIHRVAPHARLVRLNAPPVTGGVLWGMRAAGLDVTAVRVALLASANALIDTGIPS